MRPLLEGLQETYQVLREELGNFKGFLLELARRLEEETQPFALPFFGSALCANPRPVQSPGMLHLLRASS